MAVTQIDLDNSTLMRVDELNHQDIKQALINADGIGYFDTLADFKASTKVYKEVHINDGTFGSLKHYLLPDDGTIYTEQGGIQFQTFSGRWYKLGHMSNITRLDWLWATDSTSSVMLALSMASGYRVVDGGGKKYRVSSTINIIESNVVFQNMELYTDTDIIILSVGKAGEAKASGIYLNNLKVTSDGHGQDNAGLINVVNCEFCKLSDIEIKTDNAQGQVLQKHSNGISFSSCNDISGKRINVDGTTKSCFHLSTASNRIKLLDCSGKNTGNYLPDTYGYSPALDVQGENCIIENFYSENTQGEGVQIHAGDGDTCNGTKFNNITSKNCGKNGFTISVINGTLAPKNVTITNLSVDGCAENGVNASVGKNIKFYNTHTNNTQKSGLRSSAGTLECDIEFNNTVLENFNLADNTYDYGVAIGPSDRVVYNNTTFKHDTPTANTKAFSYFGGTPNYVEINDFKIDGSFSPFHSLVSPTVALLDYKGNGVPANDRATSGSTYKRLDGGAGTTYYVNEAGVWVAK